MEKFSKTTRITTSQWTEILQDPVATTGDMRRILLFMFESNRPPYKASDIAMHLHLDDYREVNRSVVEFSDKVLARHLQMEAPNNKTEFPQWRMHLPFYIPDNSRPTWSLWPELQEAIAEVFLGRHEPQLGQVVQDKFVIVGKDNGSLEKITREAVQNNFKSIEDESQSLGETTRDAFVKHRIGQSKFREYLATYWQGCSVTGCKQIEVLIASHVKPWRDSDDKERLDKFNGLLLTPNLDKCFDNYLISFETDGSIIISDKLTDETRALFGITQNLSLQRVAPQHVKYLTHHRDRFYSS